MGVASLVLGIVFVCFSVIYELQVLVILSSITGLVLGIIFCVKKGKKKESYKKGLAGAILCTIAIVFSLISGIEETSTKNTLEKENKNTISTNVEENVEQEGNVKKNKQYNVGEIYEDSNLAIKFLLKNSNYKKYSKYFAPKSGNKVVEAKFEVENVGSSDEYISSYDFKCYADGYACDSFYFSNDDTLSATLSSGKKTKGSVFFEVPKNAKEIIIEFEPSIWSNQKVEFKIK